MILLCSYLSKEIKFIINEEVSAFIDLAGMYVTLITLNACVVMKKMQD